MNIYLRLIVALLVGTILGATVNTIGVAHARGADTSCASVRPDDTHAQSCIDRGWTVNKHLTLNPHGVVTYHRGMPGCRYEDGSGQSRACIWWGDVAGNGRGLTFWERGGRFHYFWPATPIHRKWQWVDSELGDALAEGSSRHATTRNWEWCITRENVVRCPDGHREEW